MGLGFKLIEWIYSNNYVLAILYIVYLFLWRRSWGKKVLMFSTLRIKIFFTLQYIFQPFWISLCGYIFYQSVWGSFNPLWILLAIALLNLPKYVFGLLCASVDDP